MPKFKIKYVKFIYCPQHQRGNDWHLPSNLDYCIGNRHTESISKYQYNGNHISFLFSDYITDDRRYDKKAKFSESEASILLLKYIEDRLKKARQNKKEMDNYDDTLNSSTIDYHRKVNMRELTFNERQAKIWRKKVREIIKSPEYMWEQLVK